MSDKPIGEDLRLRLAQSMPVLERRRAAIAEKLQQRIQSLEEPSRAPQEAQIKTSMLMELLFAGASDIAAFGGLRGLEPRLARAPGGSASAAAITHGSASRSRRCCARYPASPFHRR